MTRGASLDNRVPKVAGWFQDGFHRFLRRFLRRQFHAIAIDQNGLDVVRNLDPDLPLLVYGNHPSWWDPLVAHFLNRNLLQNRQFYAPIDATALEQYKVFAKLGFYGVEMNSKSGAANFLKTSLAILESPGTAIWMTPEGQFTDVRRHDVPLMPGLSHLCSKLDRGVAMPLVLEYVFWDERLPACLALIGEPLVLTSESQVSKQELDQELTLRMRNAQTKLAELAIQRSSAPFENLLAGKRGAGVFYDSLRRLKSWATGSSFRASHGEQFE